MLVLPDQILLQGLKIILDTIREDFRNNTDETKTMLYYLVSNLKIGKYDFWKEAKSVFMAPPTDPRFLDINLFFNSNRAHIPTIHLMMNSDEEIDGYIGLNAQLESKFIDDAAGTYRQAYSKRYKGSYNVVCTSDNPLEVALLYNVLKACSVSFSTHFALNGLINLKTSGQDIQIMEDVVPASIFTRSMRFDFDYEITTPDYIQESFVKELFFKGTHVAQSNEVPEI